MPPSFFITEPLDAMVASANSSIIVIIIIYCYFSDPVTSQTGGSLADQQLRDRLAASSGGIELDHVRDRVHAVNLSSPKHHWQFRLPRDRLNELRPPPIHSKEAASNGADLIHPSPHLPSPNWSTINDIIKVSNICF